MRSHQVAVPELAEVVRHEALRLVDQRGQLPHRSIAAGELAEEPPADRMADETQEQRGDRRSVGVRHIRHHSTTYAGVSDRSSQFDGLSSAGEGRLAEGRSGDGPRQRGVPDLLGPRVAERVDQEERGIQDDVGLVGHGVADGDGASARIVLDEDEVEVQAGSGP